MWSTRCERTRLFLSLLSLLALLSSCGTPEGKAEPSADRPSAVPPSVTEDLRTALATAPAALTSSAERLAPGPAGISAATPTAPAATAAGETVYLGVDQVQGLVFTGEDTLWAATTGGAARWNLVTGSHEQYMVADGLASNYVTDVAQAPDGCLWFATLGGVSCLDEGGWTTYTEADGLVDDAVQTIEVAQDGTVWAGTTEGASRFDGTSWTTHLPGDRTWAIAVAPDGAVWFANDAAGLRRHTSADDAWTTHRVDDDPMSPGVKTVGVAPDGGVWVYLGYDQVYRFDGQAWESTYDAGGQWVCDAASGADGTPWIATCEGYRARGAGLATVEDGGWRHLGPEDGIASPSVRAVAVGPDGQVAAGTDAGLSVYRAGKWQTLLHGPARNRVTSVAVTPDGVAWFGFGDSSYPPVGGGVSRFDGQRWETSNQATGFPIGDNVRVLEVDPDGRLWAAAGCEVSYRAEGAWHRVAGCEDLHGNVIGIAFDPGGPVWIASDFNVYRIDGQEWSTWEHLLPTAIVVASDGAVVIGQSPLGDGGVWAYDGESWELLSGSPPCVRDMVTDGKGTVWAVGCEGNVLYRWVEGSWDEINAPDSLPAGRVADIAPSTAGETWIVTEHGIGHLGTAGWMVRERTCEGDVYGIAIAPDRSIWLATSRGAVHAPPL